MHALLAKMAEFEAVLGRHFQSLSIVFLSARLTRSWLHFLDSSVIYGAHAVVQLGLKPLTNFHAFHNFQSLGT
jgi:hypothetical protein